MTNEELLDQIRKIANEQKEHAACPSCGHCPTCGRGGHQVAPWVIPMPYYQPYPYWNYGPTWVTTPTITCGAPAAATSNTVSMTNLAPETFYYTATGN